MGDPRRFDLMADFIAVRFPDHRDARLRMWPAARPRATAASLSGVGGFWGISDWTKATHADLLAVVRAVRRDD